jgi:NADH:ubiquinone oxidoreductase subunit K
VAIDPLRQVGSLYQAISLATPLYFGSWAAPAIGGILSNRKSILVMLMSIELMAFSLKFHFPTGGPFALMNQLYSWELNGATTGFLLIAGYTDQ